MRRPVRTAAIAACLVSAACLENTAPGNDRAAEMDRPAPPAEVVAAGEALAGVETSLLMPETMTDADRRNAPEAGGCLFRMTEVGFPVAVYGDGSAVVKLNGKLIPLDGVGEGRYVANGVDLTIRPLDEVRTGGERFPAEFVLRLPGAPNELGFHGFAECGGTR